MARGSVWPFDCVVDESSSFKSHQRWKKLKAVRKYINRVIELGHRAGLFGGPKCLRRRAATWKDHHHSGTFCPESIFGNCGREGQGTIDGVLAIRCSEVI